MKEATGELNMTIVTLIAVAAIGSIFYFFVWPTIQRSIVNQTCKTYGDQWRAVRVERADGTGVDANGSAVTSEWMCCPANATTIADGCVGTE